MGALSGIKVVDLTSMVSGPVAATILADQGAEVSKLSRSMASRCATLALPIKGRRPLFSCNRGKQSLPWT